MRLNPDCIREILLFLEANHAMDDDGRMHPYQSGRLLEGLKEFQKEDIHYSVKYMTEDGLLDGRQALDDRYIFHIYDITPKGHEFLQNTRDPRRWDKIKALAGKMGSFATSTLMKIAAGMIESAVRGAIGM